LGGARTVILTPMCDIMPDPEFQEIVCLVDDDIAVLQGVGRLLTADGYAIRSFNDPQSFLHHVQNVRVPLVVLDVWMEGMSGLDVQARLHDLSPHTRVIIMTGRETSAMRTQALANGAVAFLSKPFDDEQFLQVVRGALRSCSGGMSPPPELRGQPNL
jgi:FixJ family two-component response regulator